MVEIYKAELVYLLVKRNYDGVKSPSEYADSVMKPKGKPKPDSKIIDELIDKL